MGSAARTPGRAASPDTSVLARLTVAELLAGWHSSVRGVREPDTLSDCSDYVRYLDAVSQATHDADAFCERLASRVAAWVDAEVHDCARLLNRLTPPG